MGQHNTYLRELVAQEATDLISRVTGTFDSIRDRLPFGDEQSLPGEIEGELDQTTGAEGKREDH
jgi:hypothetical protein